VSLPNVYVDLAEAPSDDPPPDLGDGGSVPAAAGEPAWPGGTTRKRHAAKPPAPRAPVAESLTAAAQGNLVVPFTRLIRAGSTGRDVIGVKRAIWRGNDLKARTGFTRLFGPVAVRQLQAFQHAHGLAADGQVGPETLRALAPFFDPYAYFLYEGYPPGLTPVEQKRQRALAYLVWAYNHRPQIHYAETRPMTLMNDLQHLPVAEDCSTLYTKMAKYAGWPDPNGNGYDGSGNTTTLCQHGRKITRAQLQVGDGVFYSSPAHVGGYVGGGRIISHGSEAGPSLTPIDYRPDLAQCRGYL